MDRLKDLLATKNWKEADAETANIIFTIANVESGRRYLSDAQWDSFPCEDLQTINQLWVDYSKGHFGFSVQKEIYQSFSITKNHNQYTWRRFGVAVGWYLGTKLDRRGWIGMDCTFDLTAPRGHLPVMGRWVPLLDDWSDEGLWCGWSIASRGWYSEVTGWHIMYEESESHHRFSSFMSKFINCTSA